MSPLKHISEWREGTLVERDVFIIPVDHLWEVSTRQDWEQHMAQPHAETIGLDANGERVLRDPSAGWWRDLHVVGCANGVSSTSSSAPGQPRRTSPTREFRGDYRAQRRALSSSPLTVPPTSRE